jgi:hypothetical protein
MRLAHASEARIGKRHLSFKFIAELYAAGMDDSRHWQAIFGQAIFDQTARHSVSSLTGGAFSFAE